MRCLKFLSQGWEVVLLFFMVTSQVNAAIGKVERHEGESGCFEIKTQGRTFNPAQTEFDGNLNENDTITVLATCKDEKAFIVVTVGGKEYPPIKKGDSIFTVKKPTSVPNDSIIETVITALADLFIQKFDPHPVVTKKGSEPCHPLWKDVNQLVAKKGKRNIQIGLSKDCALYKQPPDEVQNNCGTLKETDWLDTSIGEVTLEIGEKFPCQVMMKWNKGSSQGQETLSFKEDTSIATLIEPSESFSPHLQALWLINQKGAKSAIEAYQLVVKAEADEKKGVKGVQLVRELITLGGVSPQGKR